LHNKQGRKIADYRQQLLWGGKPSVCRVVHLFYSYCFVDDTTKFVQMFLDANGELSPGTVGLLVLAFTLQFTSAQCTDRHKQQADFGGIICIRSGTRRSL